MKHFESSSPSFRLTSQREALKLGAFESDFSYANQFRFFSCIDIFSKHSYHQLLRAFEQLSWTENRSHFYQQYSAKILKNSPAPFNYLFEASFFMAFKKKVEVLLDIELRNTMSLVAHKLISSQQIGIHNDYCDPDLGYENYRFVFQFAKPNQKTTGGEIVFLSSDHENHVIKKYSYSANYGICFEITPYSYHLVTPVEGERHTLVMYLWGKNKKYDGSGTEIN